MTPLLSSLVEEHFHLLSFLLLDLWSFFGSIDRVWRNILRLLFCWIRNVFRIQIFLSSFFFSDWSSRRHPVGRAGSSAWPRTSRTCPSWPSVQMSWFIPGPGSSGRPKTPSSNRYNSFELNTYKYQKLTKIQNCSSEPEWRFWRSQSS